MSVTSSPLSRSAIALLAVLSALVLSSCGSGNDNPFAGKPTPGGAGTSAITLPPETGAPAATEPTVDTSTPPIDPLPTNPAAAPGPNASSPTQDPAAAATELQKHVQEDQEAMLNARTMVSIIEGCHSGRESYKDCNTQKELGSEKVLGVKLGKQPGELKVSASPRGFRVTANSLSGAKFTVARGPGGDRFKCIAGPAGGACPSTGTWSW